MGVIYQNNEYYGGSTSVDEFCLNNVELTFSSSSPYTATVTNSNVTADSKIFAAFEGSASDSTSSLYKAADANVVVDSGANGITFTASKAISGTLTCDIIIKN